MSIKLKQPTMWLATFFFFVGKSSDTVEWSWGHSMPTHPKPPG